MLDTPLNQSEDRIIVELDRLEHRPCDKIRHLQAVAVEGIDVPDTNRWGEVASVASQDSPFQDRIEFVPLLLLVEPSIHHEVHVP